MFFTPRASPKWRKPRPLFESKVDALIDQARREVDRNSRKKTYADLQLILANELPYIDLWYLDNVLVHNKRVHNLQLNPAGNYDFLRTAEIAPSTE